MCVCVCWGVRVTQIATRSGTKVNSPCCHCEIERIREGGERQNGGKGKREGREEGEGDN